MTGGARHVYATAAEVADAVAELIVSRVAAAEDAFHLFLAGGDTPRAAYAALAQRADRVDWRRVELWFGDERAVGPDHPDSNFGMVRAALLDEISIPPGNVHRIRGELGAAAAAADLDERLDRAGITPDLILLGLGTDGHTASLFPGSSALEEVERWACACLPPHAPTPRITVTRRLLDGAELAFVVTGARKAAMVDRVTSGAEPALPAARVAREGGGVHWFLDRDAAGPDGREPGVR